MEQNESILKSSDKNREVNLNLVRIFSARVRLVCIQYFSTLRRARNNFLQPRVLPLKLRQKSKIADQKNAFYLKQGASGVSPIEN